MFNNDMMKELYYNISQFIDINLLVIKNDDREIYKLNNYSLPKFINELESSISNMFLNEFKTSNNNTILFYTTDFSLKYMGFAFYNDDYFDGCLLLGPYLTTNAPSMEIHDMAIKNNLSLSVISSLSDFFKRIPILNDSKENFLSNAIFAMLNTDIFHIDKINLSLNSDVNNHRIDFKINDYNVDIENIRNRYKSEYLLSHYISIGDEKSALELTKNNSFSSIDRLPDYPVRNAKNLTITLNTICRKAVENSNIDTYLIHLLSEKYAIKIENLRTIKEITPLITSMVKSYCNLVNEHSSEYNSQIINNAIHYLKINYKNDISLEDVANSLFVHPNYLSSKFKNETGYSVTEFLNNLRIKEAKLLLKSTNHSISTIAYSVGYNDSKYFARIFKKFINITPSQYRNLSNS
ncbi:MAG: helix-turn-helix transcriptional regulator [Peptostreptococcaceae bacterium]